MSKKRQIVLPLVLLALPFFACTEDPLGSGAGLSIVRVSGNDQTAVVGTMVAAPLVVLVTDAGGQPAPDQRIDFTVVQGAAQVLTEAAVTGDGGSAQVRVRLGQSPGAVVVRADLFGQNLSVDFGLAAVEPDTPTATDLGDTPSGLGNGVLRLDGDDDWVQIPVLTVTNPLAYPGSGGWSVEAWIKLASLRTVAVVAGQASINTAGHDPYYLEIGDGSGACCGGGSFKINSASDEKVNSGLGTPGIPVGEWVHVAGTYADDGGSKSLSFYVNGVRLSRRETTARIDTRASRRDPFAIGSLASFYGDSGWVPVHGDIDEVRVWDRALTAVEVVDNMSRTLTGAEAGLRGYWNFESLTSEQRVPDLTGNGNDGILMFDAHLATAGLPQASTTFTPMSESHDSTPVDPTDSTHAVPTDGSLGSPLLTTSTAGSVEFTLLSANGEATIEFGLGTPSRTSALVERDVIYQIQSSAGNFTVSPSRTVRVGPYPAGAELDFYMRSVFGNREYWAFSSSLNTGATASDRVVFLDTDSSLSLGGGIVETLGTDHWVLHMDDPASVQFDDDDNELVVDVRVLPE